MSLFISIFVPVSSCLFSGTVASAAAERGKRLPARVTRVFDGASFQVGGGLRGALIGITAPALNARGGKESFAFLRGLLEGKNVRLEIDKNLVDVYGQARYYVYMEDGTFVNALVLLRGYARAVIKYPNVRHREKLLKAEKFAKSFKRGIWGNDFRDPNAPEEPPDFDRPPSIFRDRLRRGRRF